MNKMKKEYSSPEIEVMDFKPEGTLCTSGEETNLFQNSMLEGWTNGEFQWGK